MDHANAPATAATLPNGATNGTPNGSNLGVTPTSTAKTPPEASQNRVLAEMLRRSLDGARGNPEIRERLEQLAKDSARVETIVRTLGPRHAVVRELSRLRERPVSNSAA